MLIGAADLLVSFCVLDPNDGELAMVIWLPGFRVWSQGNRTQQDSAIGVGESASLASLTH